jgi:phosphoribosylamine-glycine ligase
LRERYSDNLRVYPGSMELRENGETFALGSRAVGTVGIGETIDEAREISLEGIRSIDGALWNRWDIAAPHYIERSTQKMQQLRG